MSQIVKNVLRGLLIPDRRMEAWDEESGEYDAGSPPVRLAALPTGGPLPGIPEPQGETEMTLQSAGTQSAGGALRLQTQRGGFPVAGGATFVWQNDGETDWRGCDTPNVLVGWEPLDWDNVNPHLTPHAITLADDTILVVAQERTIVPEVVWYKRSTAGVWTSGTVGSPAADPAHPCLCPLPDGRVLCFHWYTNILTGIANVRMEYSDDDGATWTLGATGVLPVSIDTTAYTPKRLRAAYKDGQILLVACIQDLDTGKASEDLLVQYASIDLGSSFVEVDRTEAGADPAAVAETSGGYQDIVVADGRFVVSWLSLSDDLPRVVRMASAFDPFTAATVVTMSGAEPMGVGADYYTDGDLAMWRDEAANLYLTGRQVTVNNEWIVLRSRDGGLTWASMARSSSTSGTGKWWDSGDASTYPRDACVTWHRGRAVVIHSHASSPSTYDESLSASFLGGHTNVTMPGYDSVRDDALQVTFGTTYLPFDLPGNVTGITSSGAGSETNATGLLVVSAGAGQSRLHSWTPNGSADNGIMVGATVEAVSGTSRLIVTQGTSVPPTGFGVYVDVTTTSLTVRDAVSGATIDSAVTLTAGTEVQVLVGLRGDAVKVWYRAYDTLEVRDWILVADEAALTDDGTGATLNEVAFGLPTGLSAGRSGAWRIVSWVDDEGGATNYAGNNLDTFTNPDDLWGCAFSSIGSYVGDGVTVRAVDGPTFPGDVWHIDTRYTWPRSNLVPHLTPSPRRGWRSGPMSAFNASTKNLHLAWRIDTDGDGAYLDADCALENDLVGVWLDGLNCAAVWVDLYYGGAWHNVGRTDVDKWKGTRTGNAVRPTSSSTTGEAWRLGEADGCGIGFYSGPGDYTDCDWTGTVARNTEGLNKTSGITTKRPTFVLADPDGASATSPNVGLWPRRTLLLIHASGYSRNVRGLRLRIPYDATSTVYPGRPASGYYAVGKVVFGSVAVFGHDYSNQRNISLDPNTTTTELDDGTLITRVRGPAGRTVAVAWTDPIDMSDYHRTSPDYVKASANASAEAVAYRSLLPYWLQDLVAQMQGAALRAVYIPRITYDSAGAGTGDVTTTWTNQAGGSVYGAIVSPVRIEQVLGEEESTDVYRVTTVEIREER